MIRGYLNREEATAETIDGFCTGDLARVDEDDSSTSSTARDMVLRGGENVPAEVESAIFDHDAVAECVVFGIEDDRLGGKSPPVWSSKTALSWTPRPSARTAWRISKHKTPRYMWFQRERLPRNANGSPQREVRESPSRRRGLTGVLAPSP